MIVLKQILALAILIKGITSCDPCMQNKLSSNGGFGIYYPRFLGTWTYQGEFDGNPFYTCADCMGLRAYIVSVLH